ncbi:MAG TPA: alpha/beta hydrolase [Thermomicrobiales bacterium]|nr:alpha/beta hydrolase [Thermomicrobiales bacterium]
MNEPPRDPDARADVPRLARPLSRRQVLQTSGAALAALGLAGALAAVERTPTVRAAAPRATNHRRSDMPATPNIVLVHGAWADGSSWGRVIGMLQEDGYPVFAVPIALASLAGDVQATQQFFASQGITGPTVLVGHSYGGAVISGAAAGLPDVRALVYVAAFAPDEGESINALLQQFPPTPVLEAVRFDQYGLAWLDRAQFPEVFAQDVDRDQARVLAAVQRPFGASIFDEPAGRAAWHNLPTWFQISNQDRVIGAPAETFFARRMGATTIALDAGHASLVSHPQDIARLIRQAAQAIAR